MSDTESTPTSWNLGLRITLSTVAAAVVGLGVGLAVTAVAGESPWSIFTIIVRNAFGSAYDFGFTAFYASVLALTGLATLVPYRAGMFNIGAEGQMLMGALAVTALGIALPDLPTLVALPLAFLVALAAGGAWAGVAGALRTWRGGHEVISSIMLNYIAAAVVSYVVLDLLQPPDAQTPESALVGENFRLSPWDTFESSPFTTNIFVTFVVIAAVHMAIEKTRPGFALRATGMNERASELGGIDTGWVRFLAMVSGGAMAGLAGFAEVVGNAHRFRLGFSPEFGFTGIAVALVARGRPWAVVPSALLFAALHKGTSGLDLDSAFVTRDLALILQSFIILAVTAQRFPRWWRRRQTKA